MPTTLEAKAVERSTYVITAAFFDEDDSAVVPTNATWTLTDDLGNVINSRKDVAIVSLDTTVDIVLSSTDLLLPAGAGQVGRVLTVNAVYDSDLGSGLPLVAKTRFVVENVMHESE